MQNLISSQRHLDPEIVASKVEAGDFVCSAYALEMGGTLYHVLVDGHHSYAAAREAGVAPKISLVSGPLKSEYDAEVEAKGADGWLADHWHDADWYFLATGKEVF